MLWICFYSVTTKELFLKIAATKRMEKSLKTTSEAVSFYYISKLYTWNLLKTILSEAFLKGFAKIACDVNLYRRVRNIIIYFAKTFRCFFSWSIYYSSPFFLSNLWAAFSRKTSLLLFHLIHVWKKHRQKTKISKNYLNNFQV